MIAITMSLHYTKNKVFLLLKCPESLTLRNPMPAVSFNLQKNQYLINLKENKLDSNPLLLSLPLKIKLLSKDLFSVQ